MPTKVPAHASTAVKSESSPTAAQARMPVRTAIAVAIRNVIECSGAGGMFARLTISMKPMPFRSGATLRSMAPRRSPATLRSAVLRTRAGLTFIDRSH